MAELSSTMAPGSGPASCGDTDHSDNSENKDNNRTNINNNNNSTRRNNIIIYQKHFDHYFHYISVMTFLQTHDDDQGNITTIVIITN